MNPVSRKVSRLACVVLLGVSLASCGSGRSAESKALVPQDPGDLTNTDWILVGKDESDAVPPSKSSTLRIEKATASGNGPCNGYNLAFAHESDSDNITTGTVASTQIACAPRLASAETMFFRALEAVDTAEMESDHLVLSGPDDVRLVFERAGDPAAQLAGKWRIVSVAAPDALTTLIKGTAASLDFGTDGILRITKGCNDGTSTWTASGDSITIEPPRATERACLAPSGFMDQEHNILEALPRAKKVDLSNDSAVLLDAAGVTVLVLDRES